MPLVNVVYQIWMILTPELDLENELVESYVIFCFVLYVLRIVEFFTVIRRSIVEDAQVHLKNPYLNLSKAELNAELLKFGEV